MVACCEEEEEEEELLPIGMLNIRRFRTPFEDSPVKGTHQKRPSAA